MDIAQSVEENADGAAASSENLDDNASTIGANMDEEIEENGVVEEDAGLCGSNEDIVTDAPVTMDAEKDDEETIPVKSSEKFAGNTPTNEIATNNDSQVSPETATQEAAEEVDIDANEMQEAKAQNDTPVAVAKDVTENTEIDKSEIEEAPPRNDEHEQEATKDAAIDANEIEETPLENDTAEESSLLANDAIFLSNDDTRTCGNDNLDESWENVRSNEGALEETSVVSQNTVSAEPVVVDNQILFSDDNHVLQDNAHDDIKEDEAPSESAMVSKSMEPTERQEEPTP
ncbi:MAG: hypothetical protein SGILL_010695 [Bacillariaceae sp.]